jgi:hypothetical protein
LLSVQAPLSVSSPLSIFSAGTLKGTSTIIGNVFNSGFVLPGLSPGTLTINGNYTQTAAGVLQMEIGGAAAGQFDRLVVTGAGNLGGTLDIRLMNGFVPQPSNSFPILQYGSHTGSFAQSVGDFSTAQIGAAGLSIAVQSGSVGSTVGAGISGHGTRIFGLAVQGKVKNGVLAFDGLVEYFDLQNGIHLQSTSITNFRIDSDGQHATVTGTATLNGKKGYTFVADVAAGGTSAGQFRIRIYQTAVLLYDSEVFNLGNLFDDGLIVINR